MRGGGGGGTPKFNNLSFILEGPSKFGGENITTLKYNKVCYHLTETPLNWDKSPWNQHALQYTTSTLRLLGRFTTCLAQTTTASRLFFALNGTSCLSNVKKIDNFRF